jgi:transcriptional regulator with XRE-family HTH domain
VTRTGVPLGVSPLIGTDERDLERLALAFGRILRARRLECRLSQDDLCKVTGIHRTTISLMERGFRTPGLPTIVRLAAGLDISPKALLDRLCLTKTTDDGAS